MTKRKKIKVSVLLDVDLVERLVKKWLEMFLGRKLYLELFYLRSISVDC